MYSNRSYCSVPKGPEKHQVSTRVPAHLQRQTPLVNRIQSYSSGYRPNVAPQLVGHQRPSATQPPNFKSSSNSTLRFSGYNATPQRAVVKKETTVQASSVFSCPSSATSETDSKNERCDSTTDTPLLPAPPSLDELIATYCGFSIQVSRIEVKGRKLVLVLKVSQYHREWEVKRADVALFKLVQQLTLAGVTLPADCPRRRMTFLHGQALEQLRIEMQQFLQVCCSKREVLENNLTQNFLWSPVSILFSEEGSANATDSNKTRGSLLANGSQGLTATIPPPAAAAAASGVFDRQPSSPRLIRRSTAPLLRTVAEVATGSDTENSGAPATSLLRSRTATRRLPSHQPEREVSPDGSPVLQFMKQANREQIPVQA